MKLSTGGRFAIRRSEKQVSRLSKSREIRVVSAAAAAAAAAAMKVNAKASKELASKAYLKTMQQVDPLCQYQTRFSIERTHFHIITY